MECYYMVTNYTVTYKEYLDIQKYFQTFSIIDTVTLDRIELYIMQHTQTMGSVNKFKFESSIIDAFFQITNISQQQLDVIFRNINSIGKYIIPLLRSDNRVNIIFIEKT